MMKAQTQRNLGEIWNIPIWVEHPESDSHFIGTRDDLVEGNAVEIGYALLGTEEEFNSLKEGKLPQEIIGNIFNLKTGIICHQVNCKGKMGAGLAQAIRTKWPQVYTDYMEAFTHRGLHLGDVIWSKVGDNLWVASLCGQDGYGRQKDVVYTNYDAVRTCLKTVASTNVYPIAIPKGMGCTLANGDWDTMEGIIKETIPHILIVDRDHQVVIDSFAGSHHFLSNFTPSRISTPTSTGQVIFPTVEHYYQAMKTTDENQWQVIALLNTPGQAKRAGSRLLLRQDWEQVKLQYMENGLRAKFEYPDLKAKLLATGNAELIEGNTWGDTFWGMCRGKGENHLGKILMKVRGDIKAKE